jgi:hypothetical protein
MYSPWGTVQTQRKIAEGIISVSTASHGGILISLEREKEFYKIFPNAQLFTNSAAFEEDCDWCLAALAWPEYFSDQDLYFAKETAEMENGCGHEEIDWPKYWNTEKGNAALVRINAFMEAHKNKWRRGSLCSDKKGWNVSFTRGNERKWVLIADYPMQTFYTDEELAKIAA